MSQPSGWSEHKHIILLGIADPTLFYLLGRGLLVIASLATIAVLVHLVSRLRADTERPEEKAQARNE